MIISTIQKYIIGFLLLVIAANAGLSVYYKLQSDKHQAQEASARQETKAAKEETNTVRGEVQTLRKAKELLEAELKAAQDAMSERSTELDRLKSQQEKSNEKLNNALDENRPWSSTPVPDSVRNSFGKAN
jgi:chromosome segregation ATPase